MNNETFASMRELGRLFGVTSHVIGKWLVAIGLRTADKRPSHEAFEGGYCRQEGLDHGGYFYVWSVPKTLAALRQAGHVPIVEEVGTENTELCTAQ